jgi:hypothetical protein
VRKIQSPNISESESHFCERNGVLFDFHYFCTLHSNCQQFSSIPCLFSTQELHHYVLVK